VFDNGDHEMNNASERADIEEAVAMLSDQWSKSSQITCSRSCHIWTGRQKLTCEFN
jgi:hypothetical protein